jgi:DNA segregation ATPase FtsK/SpoIIIE-like protein
MHKIPGIVEGDFDELFNSAVKIVTQHDRCSPALIQRRLSIAYARAARQDKFPENKSLNKASAKSTQKRAKEGEIKL